MYGKFFESAFTGSMYGSGPATFAIWAYVLAHQRGGTVELNPKLLAAVIGMSEEEARATIARLCEPDPESRNKAHEGRRLIRDGEYAYTVTGYPIYSKIRNENDRRDYFRVKKAEQRAKAKMSTLSTNVHTRSNPVSTSTHSDADADTESFRSSSPVSTPPKPTSPLLPLETPKKTKPGLTEGVGRVIAHYVSKRPLRKPGEAERLKVRARLEEGFSVDDLIGAIDGCLLKPFTSPESGKTFDGLELILRNSAKVNQFLAQAPASSDAAEAVRLASLKRRIAGEMAVGSR